MSYQVIKQPNGLYCIWSTYSDSIIMWEATRPDIVQYFVEKAVKDAERNITQILDELESSEQHPNPKPYYQFTMTFERAIKEDREGACRQWFAENNKEILEKTSG